MKTYANAGEYIAEELRHLMRAIRAFQQGCEEAYGCEMDFETAKREFLAHRLDRFARAFRSQHCLREAPKRNAR